MLCFLNNFGSFLSLHANLIWNCLIVFFLGSIYSYVELLQISSRPNQIWQIKWGWIYIIGNGMVALLALFAAFSDDVDKKFLASKLLIAGTSGLALLRVISINIKEKGVEDRSYTIIQILQRRIFNEFDRSRSGIDLPRLKRVLQPFDNHSQIADNLPLLFSNLMRTLTAEEQQAMALECEKFKQIKDGNEKIKCINLGAIIARYVGMDLLESTVTELKEYLIKTPQNDSSESDSEAKKTEDEEKKDGNVEKKKNKDIDDYLKDFS